jgi:hypothetical protein
MMEVLRIPETSVLTRATRRNIREDGIIRSHCHEILKSYSLNDQLRGYFIWFFR